MPILQTRTHIGPTEHSHPLANRHIAAKSQCQVKGPHFYPQANFHSPLEARLRIGPSLLGNMWNWLYV